MITNLFSTFDSNTNIILEINWISSISIFYLIPISYWLSSNRILKFYSNLLIKLYNEFKILLINKFNYVNRLFFSALIIFIFFNNFIGLFPYIFTRSRHLIFSVRISLPLWISLIIFGWIKNTNFIFSHLIPSGTPIFLIPFIVLIETIRIIIRPGTLSIRLTANIIAGHLLLTLLREKAISPIIFVTLIIILIQIILLILEISVSIIQSYVFSILGTLYTKETN